MPIFEQISRVSTPGRDPIPTYHIECPCNHLIDAVNVAKTPPPIAEISLRDEKLLTCARKKVGGNMIAPLPSRMSQNIPWSPEKGESKGKSVAGGGRTYLEKRFRIRPMGVVSKKLIGERKIAYAIRSCNFLEAFGEEKRQLRRFGGL